ncbi:GntR family transcriptional regulator [Martelella mediterranea]|uniref:GntR family transcriptional regulator n=1 Tax=Martelella mediterranea TaxID=293089 RepID=UPI001E3A2479|nr:GntR family transcriptional regulator [Martelella mediterranea]MCD1636457.1 GntR family transcriptional regulator [Martelella mediterranea]
MLLAKKTVRKTMSLAEQIAQQVAESIVQEELAPGQAITEQSLSDSFQVSRGPVREALRILEKEGLVDIIPRQGARVTHLTINEINQVFELRAVLLGYCAARAAHKKTRDCVEALTRGCAALERNLVSDDSLGVHMDVSAEMNEKLVTEAENLRIQEMVFQLARQTARYTRLGLSEKAARENSVETWRELIRLIAAGNEREAEMLERRRVLDVRQFAARFLDDETSANETADS